MRAATISGSAPRLIRLAGDRTFALGLALLVVFGAAALVAHRGFAA